MTDAGVTVLAKAIEHVADMAVTMLVIWILAHIFFGKE